MANYCLKVGKSPQKSREFFTASKGLPSDKISALAMDTKGRVYIGTDNGLAYYDGKKLQITAINGKVTMLWADDEGSVWAGADNMLYKITAGKAVYSQEIDSEAVGIDSDDNGTVWLGTKEWIYKFNGVGFEAYSDIDFGGAKALAAVGDGDVYVSVQNLLQALHGKRPRWSGINSSNSGLPSETVNALAADRYRHLWVGTDKGLCVYDGKREWLTYDNIDALTKADITCIEIAQNGAVYVGTTVGLYILNGTKRQFVGCERWIPAEEVTAVAVSPDGNEFWVGTNSGVSRITIKMMSLKEKADFYQAQVEKYNVRNGAYVMHRELDEKGNIETGHVHISDNDGLWTATYLLAQAMRYGVTKDKEALELARRSKNALLKLMSITGVEGFVARAYRRPNEIGFGDGHHEWYRTKDEQGELEWKCETSSDETSGHFYAMAYYFDICADKKEKEEIKTAMCKLLDYIIQNDYMLYDVDGKPTTWAHWNPEELNGDDKWFWEKGINALEMLSYLKTCYHMSGDEKYQSEYLRLIKEHHFAMNCVQHKIHDAHVTHIDDHLGFIVIPMLLMYETDPVIRQFYLLGTAHHWQNQRIERCPQWNIIYGALTGEHCDIENAVRSLEEIPLDLINWPLNNSKRRELVWDEGQEAFGGGPQLKEPLPYDEKNVHNYDGNPFRADGGNGKRFWDPTNIFLAPYWMARYYGLIEEV